MNKIFYIFKKNILQLLIISSFFVLVGSECEDENCAVFTFRNKTEHKISILCYIANQLSSVESVELQGFEDIKIPFEYCGFGDPGNPYYGSDSLFICFNDTLKVELKGSNVKPYESIYGNESILVSGFKEVKIKNNFYYYEYEFTDWHYQKALEANGYK